jgi:uncharacterized integral membrane protein
VKKMEAVVIIVLTLLVSIVILQNTQAVETKLLFLTASHSLRKQSSIKFTTYLR